MKALFGLAAAAALAAGVWFALPAKDDTASIWQARYATPAGAEVALERWHGQPLVINFWASWCPPCRAEMPDFDRLRLAWRAKGVEFVGIALDTPANTATFLEQHPVSYPIVVGDASASALSRQFGGRGLPHTLVLDRGGAVVLNHVGRLNPQALEAALRKVAN